MLFLSADRAASVSASVSAYVGLISAVQTLEQTHSKSKLYTTCLGDRRLTLTKASAATLPRQSAQKHL